MPSSILSLQTQHPLKAAPTKVTSWSKAEFSIAVSIATGWSVRGWVMGGISIRAYQGLTLAKFDTWYIFDYGRDCPIDQVDQQLRCHHVRGCPGTFSRRDGLFFDSKMIPSKVLPSQLAIFRAIKASFEIRMWSKSLFVGQLHFATAAIYFGSLPASFAAMGWDTTQPKGKKSWTATLLGQNGGSWMGTLLTK